MASIDIEDAEFEPVGPQGRPARLQGSLLLGPAVEPSRAGLVVQQPAQALQQPIAQPSSSPVVAYLTRYTSENSRRAMLGSLAVCARLLTGSAVDVHAVPWHEVRYTHVQMVRSKLAASYARASANRHLLALRGIMRECWQLGLIDDLAHRHIAGVAGFKVDRREHGRALTPGEVRRLFAACDDTPLGLRDAAVIALTVGAGLRRSEVCTLTVENWKAAESRLEVRGKGDVWRFAHLSPKNAERIEAWLAHRGRAPGPLICKVTTRHGLVLQPLASFGLYRALQQLGARAGVTDFTPHDLRRTFITRLLEKGADVVTVSKLVGHLNIETTKRYDKRGDEAKRAAVQLLDDDEEVPE